MKQSLTYIQRNSYFIVLAVVLLFFACSCSSRKVQTETQKEKLEVTENTEIKKDSTTETVTNFDVKTVVDSTSEEITETTIYTPIDNTQISTYIDDNGKKKDFLNTSVKKERKSFKSKKKAIIENNTEIVDKHQNKGTVKKKRDINAGIVAKKKEIDRKSVSWSWLWVLLILIAIAIYKNKEKFLPILRFFK